MTDDLKERLRINLYYSWGDESDVGEQALSYITDLEARLAAAVEVQDRLMSERYQHYLRAEAAEAGEDALAEALRERDGGVHDEDCRSHRLNMGMFAQSCNCGHEDALAALAAYEARRNER